MSLQPLKPVFVLLLVVAAVGLVWAVGLAAKGMAFVIALAFPAFMTIIVATANWSTLTGAAGSATTLTQSTQRNAELIGYIFAWGGLSMFAVYSLTQLWWFHSWQYGLAMLVLAAVLFAYAHLLEDENSLLRRPAMLSGAAWLALGQSVAILIGLAFLFSTGKLFIDGRADWPANYIFVSGGLGVAITSLIAAAATWRLNRFDGRTAVNGA